MATMRTPVDSNEFRIALVNTDLFLSAKHHTNLTDISGKIFSAFRHFNITRIEDILNTQPVLFLDIEGMEYVHITIIRAALMRMKIDTNEWDLDWHKLESRAIELNQPFFGRFHPQEKEGDPAYQKLDPVTGEISPNPIIHSGTSTAQ